MSLTIQNEDLSVTTSSALASENTLQAVLLALNNVDANTDQAETLLNSVITELQNNGTLNNSNLQNVITSLNSIDANTVNLETILNSIATNTSVSTNTVLSVNATTAGTTPANIKSVTFTCFTGVEIINGATVPANAITSITYDKDNDKFSSIPYDPNGGEIRIDYFF